MTKLAPRNREGWTQVHISFSTLDMEIKVTEERFRSLFEKYGEITDVTVKKHMRTADPVSQSGYGFVYFLHGESGVQAIQDMKSTTIDEIHYECSLSYKSELMLNIGSTSSASTPIASASSTPTACSTRQNASQSSSRSKNSRHNNGSVSTATTPTASAGPISIAVISNDQQVHTAPATPTALAQSTLTSASNSTSTASNSSQSHASKPNIDVSILRSLPRLPSAGGKSADAKHVSSISRPPPLVTQFSQSRMTIAHNLRVNPNITPVTVSSSSDTTPSSSPSYFTHESVPNAHQIGSWGSMPSSSGSSPRNTSDPTSVYFHSRSLPGSITPSTGAPQVHHTLQLPAPLSIPSPSAKTTPSYMPVSGTSLPIMMPSAAGPCYVSAPYQQSGTPTANMGTTPPSGTYMPYHMPVHPSPMFSATSAQQQQLLSNGVGNNNMTMNASHQPQPPSQHMVYHQPHYTTALPFPMNMNMAAPAAQMSPQPMMMVNPMNNGMIYPTFVSIPMPVSSTVPHMMQPQLQPQSQCMVAPSPAAQMTQSHSQQYHHQHHHQHPARQQQHGF